MLFFHSWPSFWVSEHLWNPGSLGLTGVKVLEIPSMHCKWKTHLVPIRIVGQLGPERHRPLSPGDTGSGTQVFHSHKTGVKSSAERSAVCLVSPLPCVQFRTGAPRTRLVYFRSSVDLMLLC